MSMKKKSSGGGANWMDTYGDMVTLLLCFFVLLYSMSTISEDNWKALVMSFNPLAAMDIRQTSGAEGPDADNNGQSGVMPSPEENQEEIDADIEALFQALQSYVADQNMETTIAVTKGDGKVFVSFGQAVFFDGNSPTLRTESYPILDAVSAMLDAAASSLDDVRIQGHTAQADPNRPNNAFNDRNLSAQRAANVVAYIQEHCTVDPGRLISEGFGQWRPKATNLTAEGRAQNRRVEMIISGRDLEQEAQEGITQYYTTK
ncbi:MAG: flagellar motor protein MotB [Oscillibacter sp.]|nr:flagellar motor protein MotB [Oscillibacter sp.]